MISPIIGEYCDSTPSSKISSSNRLFIHFHSDWSGTGSGFKLEYNATSKNPYKVDILFYFVCIQHTDYTKEMKIRIFVTSSRLCSAAFWKNITGLKSHMTGYDFNINSWQNQSWDCLTVPYCTGGPRILWLLFPKNNHEMPGSWILRTVCSVKPQNGSKNIFEPISIKFWFFPYSNSI